MTHGHLPVCNNSRRCFSRMLFSVVFLVLSAGAKLYAQTPVCDLECRNQLCAQCDDGDPCTVDICKWDTVLTGGYKFLGCERKPAPNVTWYLDRDNDRYYTAVTVSCTSPGQGWTKEPGISIGDCNDNRADINPGVKEICDNNVDDNCDGKIDEECAAVEIVVKDIRMDSIIGRLVQTPLGGVGVEVYKDNVLVSETETNSEGQFDLSSLDSDKFYTIKFHYQNEEGRSENVFVDYEYTGYKKGDPIDDVLLPYTMLLQAKHMLRKIVNKNNYEIKYLLGFLDMNNITAQNRKVYDVHLLQSLIEEWQTIDKIQAKDVIDNLGRVYIFLFALDEFSEDAYKLSKLPAQSISGILSMVLSYLELAKKLRNAISPPENSLGFVIDDVVKLQDDAIYSLISLAFTWANNILEARSETITDPEEKEFINELVRNINLAALVITTKRDRIDGEMDLLQSLIEELVNNKIFVSLYERHIENTQELVANAYSKARLLVPPDGTFEEAAKRVMINDNSSLVSSAHAQTELVVEKCDSLYFDNVQTLDKVLSFQGSIEAISNLTSGANRLAQLSAILKKLSFAFDGFKAINYGLALYSSLDRMSQNRKEAMRIPSLSFSPRAGIAGKKRNLSSNINYDGLLEEITAYNLKLDTVMNLIKSRQNMSAIVKAKDLRQMDSALNKRLFLLAGKIGAVARLAVKLVPDFDSLYLVNFMEPLHNTCFMRTGMAFNLAVWALDTTSVTFNDTVMQLAERTMQYNLQIRDAISYFDDLTAGVQIPVLVHIADIEGPSEMPKGSSAQIKVSYQNLGTETAKGVLLELSLDGGFTLSTNRFEIGDVPPGGEGSMSFAINSPAVDTFTFYTAQLIVSNEIGDDASSYMIAWDPETCNGIDDNNNGSVDEELFKTVFRDADGDGYGDPAAGLRTCSGRVEYVSNNLDCNDADPSIHPAVPETCDGKDNNCDGRVDEGCAGNETTYYQDADGDGYGDPANSVQASMQPEGYVANKDDCNDNNPQVHPKTAGALPKAWRFNQTLKGSSYAADASNCMENSGVLTPAVFGNTAFFFALSPSVPYKGGEVPQSIAFSFDVFAYTAGADPVCAALQPRFACPTSVRVYVVPGSYASSSRPGSLQTYGQSAAVLLQANGTNTVTIALSRPLTPGMDYRLYIEAETQGCSGKEGRQQYVVDNITCLGIVENFEEPCGNGLDDNCNGIVDEACSPALRKESVAASEKEPRALADQKDRLNLRVVPNPSARVFTLLVEGGNGSRAAVRITDAVGRVVEVRTVAGTGKTLVVGGAYVPGVYYAELVQGKERMVVKLVKQP